MFSASGQVITRGRSVPAGYPSGQRELTVNQPFSTSGVRIPHLPRAPRGPESRGSRVSGPLVDSAVDGLFEGLGVQWVCTRAVEAGLGTNVRLEPKLALAVGSSDRLDDFHDSPADEDPAVLTTRDLLEITQFHQPLDSRVRRRVGDVMKFRCP